MATVVDEDLNSTKGNPINQESPEKIRKIVAAPHKNQRNLNQSNKL